MMVVCVGTSEETDIDANMACGFAENSPDRQEFSGIRDYNTHSFLEDFLFCNGRW